MRNESCRAAMRRSTLWGGRATGLIVVALLMVGAVGPTNGSALVYGHPPPFQVLETENGGLVIEWAPSSIKTSMQGDGRVAITVPGYSRAGGPGAPLLPVSAHLVAVPPGADPQFRVLAVDQTWRTLPAPVEVAPWPEEVRMNPGSATALAGDSGPDRDEVVVLEELGKVRGVRLARLTFCPAIPDDGSLLVTRRLRVALSWDPVVRSTQRTSDPLLDHVRGLVLNPGDALVDARSAQRAPIGAASAPVGTPAASAMALLEVSEPGVYRVDHDDLDGLGFAAVDPGTIGLLRGGDEVAYQWLGDSDQQFETGESLIFYAEPRFSRWTEVDVYRLEADTALGLRMPARGADPSGLVDGVVHVDQLVERNEVYTPDCFCGPVPAGRDGDRWAWEALTRPDQSSATFSYDLEAADLAEPAELTLWFIGQTFDDVDPDHRVHVTLNGEDLGQVEWDGRAVHKAVLFIPAGALQASDNTLGLELPGIPGLEEESCWLDAFSIRHARSSAETGAGVVFEGEGERRAYTVGLVDASGLRAYDVTDPLRPERLTGVQTSGDLAELGDPPGGGPRRYVLAGAGALRVPDRIRAENGVWTFNHGGEPAGADLLIITHPGFESALEPLVALRETQGLSVAVANVMGVYDAWGDGRLHPDAIDAFVQHTYDNWTPRPSYVLLVGDGSYDPRQYLPGSSETFIPPYLADVDPWAGEAAADNRYVCVDGGDTLPDMLIGRLPVKTLQGAEAVVNKTVAYEARAGLGRWNRHVVLTADDADAAGDFPALADSQVGDRVPSSYRLTRYYCTEGAEHVSDCPAARAQQIHDDLVDTWNEGAFLMGFVGHASWQQWAVPRYFHLDDLPSLRNQAQAPVVVGMTCFTSAFQRPEPTLDESLVTLAEGGAVATWGGTGLGLTAGHSLLSEGFFDAILVDEVETVGEAEMAGKLHLAATGPCEELLDTFLVLGDPALVLNRARPREIFLPLVLRHV